VSPAHESSKAALSSPATPSATPRPGAWAAGLLLAVTLWPAIVLALFAPAYPETFFATFDAPKRVVLAAGAALLAALAFRKLRAPGREWALADPRLAIPVVLAVAALVAGMLAGVRGSVTGALTALACLAVARVVARAPDARSTVVWIARGAAAATLAASVYGLAQWAGLDRSELGRTDVPPASFFGNPSFAGEFLAAALPLAVFLGLRSDASRTDRGLAWAAAALGAAHLLLTRSRIDFVAAGAALAVAVIVLLFAGGRRRAGWIVAGTVGIGAAIVAATFVSAALGDAPAWIGRSDTLAVRTGIWGATARMIADRPLGLAGAPFIDLFPAFRTADEFRLSLGRSVATPHNDLLGVTVAVGIPGALAALWCVGLIVRGLVRGAADTIAVRTALLASLTAVLVSGLASSPLAHPTTALLAALCLGAAIALAPRKGRALPVPARALDLGAVVALALLLWPGPVLRDARTDAFLNSARRGLARGESDTVLHWLEEAVESSPAAFDPSYELGSLYANRGRLDEGVERLERAHAIRPGSLSCRVNLANALRDAGRIEECTELVDASLALCDWHPLLLTTRAALAMDAGDPRAALGYLDRAAPLLPSEPRIEARRVQVRLAIETTPELRREALAVLDTHLHGDDRVGVQQAVSGFLAQDPEFREAALRHAHGIVEERPEHALAVAAALDEAGLGSDENFLYDASRVARKAGQREVADRYNGRAWAIRARATARRGLDEQALRFAEKAVARAPSTEHFLLVAQILTKRHEHEAAVRAVGQALALGNFDPALVRDDATLSTLLPDRELEELLERAARRLRGPSDTLR